MSAILESQIPGYKVKRGKVRDVYDLGEKLLIVASDRISAFDAVMPNGIPDKGIILTQISNFWFKFLEDVCPNHLLATEINHFPKDLLPFAEQLVGRSVIARKADVIPVECVDRGYLAGGGWKEYQQTGSVSGIKLPAGMQLCQKLPEPIFTPSTKAAVGHDEPISFAQVSQQIGKYMALRLQELSLTLYNTAAEYARDLGIIIADTKFEFGVTSDGQLIVIDEVLTPDSSRFWPADQYKVGRDQPSFDKQYVRNYLETTAWNKQPPAPALPADVVHHTRAKYMEAFERLTGQQYHRPQA